MYDIAGNRNYQRNTGLGRAEPVNVLCGSGLDSISAGSEHLVLAGVAVDIAYADGEFHPEAIAAPVETGCVFIINAQTEILALIPLEITFEVIIAAI